MRLFLLTVALLIPAMSLFSQTINYTQLSATTTFNGQYEKYISKSGVVYSAGEKITFGEPSRESGNFAYVKKVDALTRETTAAGEKASGYTGVIKRIRLAGNTKTGALITFLVQGPNSSYNYLVYIENALAKKEIKPKGQE